VVDFDPPFSNETAESIVTRVYSSDGGEDMKRTFAISGEPRHPMIVTDESSPNLSTYENWQLNLEKDEVCMAWLNGWNATAALTSTGQPIDGLVLPPSSHVAHRHGEWPR
jgi:amidase